MKQLGDSRSRRDRKRGLLRRQIAGDRGRHDLAKFGDVAIKEPVRCSFCPRRETVARVSAPETKESFQQGNSLHPAIDDSCRNELSRLRVCTCVYVCVRADARWDVSAREIARVPVALSLYVSFNFPGE